MLIFFYDLPFVLIEISEIQRKGMYFLNFNFLSLNHIGDEGAMSLAATLPSCTTLMYLDLGNNDIGIQGAISLAAALPSCYALTTLCLYGNEIGNAGTSMLAAALPNCPTLTTLDVGANKISNKGAISLAAALPKCPSLSTLCLNTNEIGNEGAIVLGAALPNCPTLTTLDLFHNSSLSGVMFLKFQNLLRMQPQNKAAAALICWSRRRHSISRWCCTNSAPTRANTAPCRSRRAAST